MKTLREHLKSGEGICAKHIASKYYNTKVVQHLGGGSCGVAFLLGNGLVVKITEQASEYYYNKTLVGKTIDHVNEIYRCLSLMYDDYDYYAIVQKYVDTQKYYDAVRILYTELGLVVNSLKKFLSGFSTDEEYQDNMEKDMEILKGCKPHTLEGIPIDTMLLVANSILKMGYKLKYEADYKGSDFFHDNQGYDEERDQLVMIDLGYSGVDIDQYDTPEIVESHKKVLGWF